MIIPIVDVGGKRTLEYVAECLTKFNRGAKQVKVRAVGGGISKGVRVVQIIKNEFAGEVDILGTTITNISFSNSDNTENSCLETMLTVKEVEKKERNSSFYDIFHFSENTSSRKKIDFSIYNLLFDNILHKYGNLGIEIDNENFHGRVDIWNNNWAFNCKKPIFTKTKSDKDKINSSHENNNEENPLYDILDVYYRSGLLESRNWKEVANLVSDSDDVILGFDTNVLLKACFTEHFIDALYYFDPKKYVHTPNWILLIIPAAVMHELEQATNSRKKGGLLTKAGRIGFRALSEILEISHCIDLTGMSLIIFGETDTTLDVRAEMYGLKDFLIKSEYDKSHKSYYVKSSSGDTIIRDQYKRFLKHVDFFGGGAYFITADKTCAALAKTEGLGTIYYKIPFLNDIEKEVTPINIKVNNGEDISIPVQIGKLIYEFCVQYGLITIKWNSNGHEKSIKIACDRKGESLDHWLYRDLFISGNDTKSLFEEYDGRFDLNYMANNVWKKIRRNLIKTDFD